MMQRQSRFPPGFGGPGGPSRSRLGFRCGPVVVVVCVVAVGRVTELPADVVVRTAREGWRADACSTLETLEGALEDLVVRGLSACGPDDVRVLGAAAAALDDAGAAHVAGKIQALLLKQQGGDKGAARALMELMVSLRVFERVLTVEGIADVLADDVDDAASATAKTGRPTSVLMAPNAPAIPAAEAKKLLPVLDDLAHAVEDLVAGGMVTASTATKERLEVSFKEASRLKLGRLAASLRYVVEEIGRFLTSASTFSGKRLALFLSRSWVLARGLHQALTEKNDALLGRLLLSWPPQAVDSIEVICVGVRKRLPQGMGVCAFDFHFRLVADCGVLPAGAPLVWSHIVPRPSSSERGAKIVAEALLHLELKPQGFKPLLLTESAVFTFSKAQIVVDGAAVGRGGGGRLMLTAETKLAKGSAFTEWQRVVGFDKAAVRDRVVGWAPSPLDLEVELAVEVAVDVGAVAAVAVADDVDSCALAFSGAAGEFGVVVNLAKTDESKELRAALASWRKTPPSSKVFGVLHFDRCRMVFQPLSLLEARGPRHLMLNLENIDLQALTKSLF